MTRYRLEQALYACILAALGMVTAARLVARELDRAFGGHLS